ISPNGQVFETKSESFSFLGPDIIFSTGDQLTNSYQMNVLEIRKFPAIKIFHLVVVVVRLALQTKALADFAFHHSKNFIVNDCFEAIYCLRTNSIN
ncbi:hypothetical protein BpHYR1_036844, partial [Brachionus plicatilis]